jgi:hypothetical protein
MTSGVASFRDVFQFGRGCRKVLNKDKHFSLSVKFMGAQRKRRGSQGDGGIIFRLTEEIVSDRIEESS